MADQRLTWDADTAAYNAKMDGAAKKGRDVVGSLAGAVPVLGQLTSAAGAMALAVGGISMAWNSWLQQLAKADEISKQLVERLGNVAGGAGVLAQFPQLRAELSRAGGPLSAEERVSVVKQFDDAYPGLTAESALEAVRQAQRAVPALGGKDGLPEFIATLGAGMEAGLSQQKAGDLAAFVATIPGGAEAVRKALAGWVERFPLPEDRAQGDFLSYLQGGSEVYGSKQIIPGRRIGQGIADGLPSLQVHSVIGNLVDPDLTRTHTVHNISADAEAAGERRSGSAGRALRELDSLRSSQFELTAEGAGGWTRTNAALDEFFGKFTDKLSALGVPGFGTAEERRDKLLEEIARNTAEREGAARFRVNGQDR